MACLETSFLVDLLRGKKEVILLKEELDRTESTLTIASPTVMELWCGALLGKLSAQEKEKINNLLQSLEVLDFDEKCAKEAGEIEADLFSKGKQIETEDIMIAAIAKVHSEKLITKDSHYLNIDGLKILKY